MKQTDYQIIGSRFKTNFNHLADHPLQTWEWGQFKAKRGVEVIRWGRFESDRLIDAFQVFIHHLPLNQKLIYFPRGRMFNMPHLKLLTELAGQRDAFMVKIEPYCPDDSHNTDLIGKLKQTFPLVLSSQPLFPKYTLRLNLTQPKEVIWKNLHPKTRYNIGLAQRRGVRVIEDSSRDTLKHFIRLINLTTKRHKFAAHSPDYYLDMFNVFKSTKVMRLLKAVYQAKVIAVWILFDWKDVLYYPYGASDYNYRRLMASNLLAWRAVEIGLTSGKRVFDFWGAAEPAFKSNHPWAGFTRFKLSYGAKYYATVGSWDLVINPIKYKAYSLAYKLRRLWLNR